MTRNGLMIQYEWCTGCHACEVACKQEHNYNEGRCGVRVYELVSTTPDKVYVDFVPVTTRFCDLCADRVKNGEAPACVKHCQATCITYGSVAELGKQMEKTPHASMFAPR